MRPAVLFDLDGTLTDPKPGITRSCAYALERLGCGVVDPDSLAWCIGPPLRESFRRMLSEFDRSSILTHPSPTGKRAVAAGSHYSEPSTIARQAVGIEVARQEVGTSASETLLRGGACGGGSDIAPEEIEEAIRLYRERFSEIGLFENEVFPGIPELLDQLQSEGVRLFLATSKPHIFANRILAHFDLARFFEGVVGSEFDGTRDAKSEVIRHVLDTFDVDPRHAVMVGDRRHDVEGAKAHGIACIGVSYGYGSEEELTTAGVAALCRIPGEVYAAFKAIHRSGVMPNTCMS